MFTRFFTNSGDNTLLNTFKGIFDNNKNIENFDAWLDWYKLEIHLIPVSVV